MADEERQVRRQLGYLYLTFVIALIVAALWVNWYIRGSI